MRTVFAATRHLQPKACSRPILQQATTTPKSAASGTTFRRWDHRKSIPPSIRSHHLSCHPTSFASAQYIASAKRKAESARTAHQTFIDVNTFLLQISETVANHRAKLEDDYTAVYSHIDRGDYLLRYLEAATTSIAQALPGSKTLREGWAEFVVQQLDIPNECLAAEKRLRSILTGCWCDVPLVVMSLRALPVRLTFISGLYEEYAQNRALKASSTPEDQVTLVGLKEKFVQLAEDLVDAEKKLATALQWIELDTELLAKQQTYAQGFDAWKIRTKNLAPGEDHDGIRCRLIPMLRELQMKGNGEGMQGYDPTISWERIYAGSVPAYWFALWAPSAFYGEITKFLKEDPDCCEFTLGIHYVGLDMLAEPMKA